MPSEGAGGTPTLGPARGCRANIGLNLSEVQNILSPSLRTENKFRQDVKREINVKRGNVLRRSYWE